MQFFSTSVHQTYFIQSSRLTIAKQHFQPTTSMCIYFLSLNIYAIHVLLKIHFNLTFLAGYFNTYHMFVIEELNLQSDIPKVETSRKKFWKYISMKNKIYFYIKYMYILQLSTSHVPTTGTMREGFSRYIGLGPGDPRGGL